MFASLILASLFSSSSAGYDFETHHQLAKSSALDINGGEVTFVVDMDEIKSSFKEQLNAVNAELRVVDTARFELSEAQIEMIAQSSENENEQDVLLIPTQGTTSI